MSARDRQGPLSQSIRVLKTSGVLPRDFGMINSKQNEVRVPGVPGSNPRHVPSGVGLGSGVGRRWRTWEWITSLSQKLRDSKEVTN